MGIEMNHREVDGVDLFHKVEDLAKITFNLFELSQAINARVDILEQLVELLKINAEEGT